MRIRQAFANASSANIKFWKTPLYKMIQIGGVIRDIRIIGNILSNLAKNIMDIVNNSGNYFLDKQVDLFCKEYITCEVSGK